MLIVLANQPAAAQGPASDYQIGVGDVLRVEVTGRQDVTNQYTVSGDGTVSLPVVGAVSAAGKTAAELASDLSRRFSLFGREFPQVKVQILEFRSRNVYVLGAVILPGVYSFRNLPTVWEAIAEAGGSTEDAQLSSVEIIRARAAPGAGAEIVDVAAAIRDGRLESIPRLGPGDTVRVPRGSGAAGTEGGVFIFGAIMRPGSLSLDQASDLVSAVIRSGGPSPDADLTRVEIVRRGAGPRVMRLRVNMQGYFSKAHTSGNPPLEPGDTVFLPRGGERRSSLTNAFRTVSPFVAIATTIAALVGRR